MRLTVVGCSGSFPGPASPASCYLIEAEGFRLVLDLGNGALGALQRYTGLYDVDAICLSHLHADHCFDLAPYYVARTYAPGGARPPIPVYAPPGAAERMSQVYGPAEGRAMTEAFGFQVLAPGEREIGPFRVRLAQMNHPVETFGFRLEHSGASVTYSADTGASAALVELARATDLLLCEASFLEEPGLPAGLHLTARQAADHADLARAGRLMLTHLVPWNEPARTLEEASSSRYPGPISLAAPGQSLDLG